MFILYNIVLTCVFILGSPYFLFKILTQSRYRTGLFERLGFIPKEKIEKLKNKLPVWFHAVSVGEAAAIFPLYKAFKEKYPTQSVVFSTTTKTGQEWVSSKLDTKDVLLYFPIDLYWIVRRVLNIVHPSSFVAVETEIWPNFWWFASCQKTKLAVLNGRLSKRSYHRYLKISFFMKSVLEKLSILSCQTEADAERFLKLGAPAKSVVVGGNLKFEIPTYNPELLRERDTLKALLGLQNEMILMGGSTHEGEEEILIQAYKELKLRFSSLRLILAPRHPERFKEVQLLIQKSSFECLLESQLESQNGEHLWQDQAILLIDRMGKLPLYYSLADIVFIGKSLKAHGGQNLLEPAALGKVILFGPHMENFRQIADQFIREKAAIEIQDEHELKVMIEILLESQSLRKSSAIKAKALVDKNKGALDLNLKYIEKYLLCHL